MTPQWTKPGLTPNPHFIAAVMSQECYDGVVTLERHGVPVRRFYAVDLECVEIGEATA